MSHRAEKRLRAGRHDGRRWLKSHPPRRGDPLWGLVPQEVWASRVAQILQRYPAEKARRESDFRNGGWRSGRRSPSAEAVYFRACGRVEAVEAALERFSSAQRKNILNYLYFGTKTAEIDLFSRYVAVFSGFGRKEWRV